jgi:hypothetical protein
LLGSSQPQRPLLPLLLEAEADALLPPPLEDEEALTHTDFLFESSQLQCPPLEPLEADALLLLLPLLPPPLLPSSFLAPVSLLSLLSLKQLCRWLHFGEVGAPSGQATRRQRAEITPRPSLASFWNAV